MKRVLTIPVMTMLLGLGACTVESSDETEQPTIEDAEERIGTVQSALSNCYCQYKACMEWVEANFDDDPNRTNDAYDREASRCRQLSYECRTSSRNVQVPSCQ